MIFHECHAPVANRGSAPNGFLSDIVAWARTAPDELFAPNAAPMDVYASVKSRLATLVGHDPSGTPIYHWDSLEQRRAAMLEVMRVHSGLEASWNWEEGADTSKSTRDTPENEETGIFQVSFDSTEIAPSLLDYVKARLGTAEPRVFIIETKEQHDFALDYYARLVRVSVHWAGPFNRLEVHRWLSRDAMRELQTMI